MKYFLYWGIVCGFLLGCSVKQNFSKPTDMFSIENHNYYAECIYQQMYDSLSMVKCLKKGDTLIIITENQCVFRNDILYVSNVNDLLVNYKNYNCSYDTSTLPYYFLCTNSMDSVLYLKNKSTGSFELEALCIKDTIFSLCGISVGMSQKDFLRLFIPDNILQMQEKLSVICIICSYRVNDFVFSLPPRTTDVMIVCFDNDTLTKIQLDYLYPTDSSFIDMTPIIDRF